MPVYPFISVYPKTKDLDLRGSKLQGQIARRLGWALSEVLSAKVFSLSYPLDEAAIGQFAQACLCDKVLEAVGLNHCPSTWPDSGWLVSIAKLAGVTDDEGISAQTALADFFNLDLDLQRQHIFSTELYYFSGELDEVQMRHLAKELLANTLIQHIQIMPASAKASYRPFVPEVSLQTLAETRRIEGLAEMSDEALMQLSKDWVLALNLEEMKAIRDYYQKPQVQAARADIGPLPTDCELEILAQTWSEHCKHKEFNATIHYKDLDSGQEKTINSLFKTYIKGATSKVSEALSAKGNDWLVKVFSDNAGVVKVNKDWLFVWKVETHNSPSALDPYGGAITGILGNNRDPLATGIGGAKLLFNTNVLCFGPPNYSKALLERQLHPRRIMEGVIAGIEDGGNKSGVPTVNGALVFDERFSGKPLVYCGTGGLMPYDYLGRPTWEKPIDAGDRIYMAGGRVGKDGIHGATFSSLEIDESAPASAVQIGSPITQKKLMDFLIVATRQGLIKCSTDNGAGGLSSSIGELAQISGGAVVQLERVPLKYSGLRPWEIFVSESQERMTLVVEPKQAAALQALADDFEVELSDIGSFEASGFLQVNYGEEIVAKLDMEFLHEGTPHKVLYAEWQKPEIPALNLPALSIQNLLPQVLGTWNVCSKEAVIRRYDHEVKGKSVVKPLMGPKGQAPQDAAVMRLGFDTWEGIAVSNGILPRYGDQDAYQMSAGAFDEALRQILAVGGRLPNQHEGDDTFWSVNDNFCVPDSVYDPEHNPDGKIKLAKLVQMCEALYDMAVFYDIPLTSGKDSMKNDFKSEGQKISVPPTILYSMTAKIADIRKVCTAEFKAPGDKIYQLGETYAELGASELLEALGLKAGGEIPRVRPEAAKALYLQVMQAHAQGLLASCHDLSDGGLGVALAESAFGGGLGATIQLDGIKPNLDALHLLFAESHSRFLVSVAPAHQAAFEALFGASAKYLGEVSQKPELQLSHQGQTLGSWTLAQLHQAWSSPLELG